MTPLDAALAYAERNWRVLPIPQGKKSPRLNKWQDAATTDPELIEQWWTQWPNDGVGIACGEASGIFVIDVDVAGGKTGDRTLADLEAQHGELPETYTVRTGSGGWHYYFRFDPARPIRNGILGPGLDIRGEGGQVLAPPTIHPVTGEAYLVHLDVPVADAPDWFYAEVGKGRQAPSPRAPRPTGDSVIDETSPAHTFDRDHTWEELLVADGWLPHHLGTDGEQYWTRPGKDPREGHSASTFYKGQDCLVVFSTDAPLPPGTYGKFGYYAELHHGGDYSLAAKALADEQLDGFLRSIEAQKPVVPASVDPDTGEIVDDGEWEDPVPLGLGVRELPTFPVDVLPAWMADHVAAVADDIQVPIDLPATIAIAALSAVAGGRIEVEADGWKSLTNLYVVVASPPGQGKSPVFSAMISCLEDLQADLATSLAPDIREAETRRRVSEKQARKAEEKGDVDEALRHLHAAMSIEIPRPPRLIADDATPEALTSLLADNGGRMAVMSSEGGVFDLMTGKYSDRANLEVFLKAWSADTIQVDRIGRDPEYVRKPALTIGLTVQPMVIQRLANKPELAGRGLTARFMYSLPPSNVGLRDMTRRRANRTPQQRAYDAALVDLYRRLASYTTAGRLSMSDEDVETFFAWRQSIELRRGAGGDLEALAEWTTKLEASVLRLAGLLHLAHGGAHHGTLDAGVLQLALRVADYWIEHAFAVHDLWGTDDTLAAARVILAWLTREELTTFTASDLQKKLRRTFDRIKDTVEPLRLLVERGWIRPTSEGPIEVGKPGKPSPGFAAHPTARPVDKHSGRGVVLREWRKTPDSEGEVSRHSRHSRKGVSEALTLSVSGSPDGVPPANGANGATPASIGDPAPVDNESAPYVAVDPAASPVSDVLDEMF